MPVFNHASMEIISRSAEQTRRIGVRLGGLLKPGDTICLAGDLGSGKTTLVQGISSGWGSLDAVTSPTFVLVNVYRRPDGLKLYHLDAYRLADASEALDLDINAMQEDGLLVIEWADRIRSALPGENLWITLDWVDVNQRDFLIKAQGEHYQKLLLDLRRQVYGVA